MVPLAEEVVVVGQTTAGRSAAGSDLLTALVGRITSPHLLLLPLPPGTARSVSGVVVVLQMDPPPLPLPMPTPTVKPGRRISPPLLMMASRRQRVSISPPPANNTPPTPVLSPTADTPLAGLRRFRLLLKQEAVEGVERGHGRVGV